MIKKTILLTSVILVSFLNLSSINAKEKQLFDFGWKFCRGDQPSAELLRFKDSTWRNIDLPHDYSIEDLPGTTSPFDSKAISGISGGFTVGGIGWYRKTFSVPVEKKGKSIEICFDGVYMNTDVWINGNYLGNHPYGYTPFIYDISKYINYGKENVIAVKVKNEGKNSRWYSGSGIYRHVWLTFKNSIHIITNGVYITTPEVSVNAATINIETSIKNNSQAYQEIILETTINNKNGKNVAKTYSTKKIAAGSIDIFMQNIKINTPALWFPSTPNLYSASTRILVKNKIQDNCKTTFGIRTIKFDAKNGFVINGTSMKLKGGCVHHDNGPLGAKAYDRAEERKVEILKNSGFNAVRTSHNPPTTAFLDACDRLGLFVIDEAFDIWEDGKNPQDYHLYYKENWRKDVEKMIVRDRNHPSIIMWSIGNEIPAMEEKSVVKNAQSMSDFIHKLEPTRPVTAAVNNLSEKLNNFYDALDICGYNYAVGGYENKYATDSKNHPNRVMFGSESYALDEFEAWAEVEKYPSVIGDFVWTAIDYIGEASIGWHGYPQYDGVFPWNLAYCGDIDICGWKRPQSHYRDAFWTDKPVISLFVHAPVSSFDPLTRDRISWSRWHFDDLVAEWNWSGFENKPLKIDVFTSCDSVELFLNGKTLGKKEAGRKQKCKVCYEVPYSAGELKAIGYKNGKQTTSLIQSTSVASTIKISADHRTIKADGQDLSYITVELCDKNGLRDAHADNLLQFRVNGPATIVGVGNANPVSLESYTAPQRKAWKGRCLVIIKSELTKGNIELIASSAGLHPVKISLKSISEY